MAEQTPAFALQDRRAEGLRFLVEQTREIAFRTPWDYLALFGLLVVTQVLLRTSGAIADPDMPAFVHGAVAWPVGLVLVIISIFWSIRVWAGLAPGDRDYYLSRPVAVSQLLELRVAAGLILFLGIFVAAQGLGAALGELLGTDEMRHANRAVQGSGWLLTLLGLVNAYLFGSIFAIRFRRPEHYVLAWIPLGFIVFWVAARIGDVEWLLFPVAEFMNSLFRGFGYATAFGQTSVSPRAGHLLLWLAFYAGIALVVANRPRRN